jgi:hypothetical protein
MKLPLALALLAAAAPLAAQVPPPAQPAAPAPFPVADPRVAALRDAALDDDYAWDIVEGLTTEVGQRLAGTEAEARARDWAVAKLKSLGFANVRVEAFDLPVWTRGAEAAEILAPFPQRMVVTALGNSGSTPPQGIQGEVVGFNSLAELEAAPEAAVGGEMVLVCHPQARTQGGAGPQNSHSPSHPWSAAWRGTRTRSCRARRHRARLRARQACRTRRPRQ